MAEFINRDKSITTQPFCGLFSVQKKQDLRGIFHPVYPRVKMLPEFEALTNLPTARGDE